MFRFHLDRLQTEERLGKGQFGAVFPYQKSPQDLKWVVKRIRADDADDLLTSLPEIVLGFACDHPCIVPVKGYFIEKDSNKESFNIYMKLPRMKETLLDNYKSRRRKSEPYSEEEITRHFYSLACGLEYLHSKKIYHGDVKPDNLLLDENGMLKIGDIGIAKHVEEEDSYQTLNGQAGTYQYSAPEIIRARSVADKKEILPKADIWSLGTVILELCAFNFRLLDSSLSQDKIKDQVNEPLKSLEGRYNGSLIALIHKMLRLDPHERPTLEEIKAKLEENFSQNLDQDLIKMANSHKPFLEAKYQAEIDALKQQIREILENSKLEKDQLQEAKSRLDLNISQQKQQDQDKIQKPNPAEIKNEPEEEIQGTFKFSNQQIFKPDRMQFEETQSKLEFDLLQQKKHYEERIKVLEKQKMTASFFKNLSFQRFLLLNLIAYALFLSGFLFATQILGYQSQETFQEKYQISMNFRENSLSLKEGTTTYARESQQGQKLEEKIIESQSDEESDEESDKESDEVKFDKVLLHLQTQHKEWLRFGRKYERSFTLKIAPQNTVSNKDIQDEHFIHVFKDLAEMLEENCLYLTGLSIICHGCRNLTSELFVSFNEFSSKRSLLFLDVYLDDCDQLNNTAFEHLTKAISSQPLKSLHLTFERCKQLNDTALEILAITLSSQRLKGLYLDFDNVPEITEKGFESLENAINESQRSLEWLYIYFRHTQVSEERKQKFKERFSTVPKFHLF